ncbi:MAG: VWA-like domain-containing protein [Eubacteriales bacterium]|nr:VWA-like domain-containing protein [Eubacteriales bacterium]
MSVEQKERAALCSEIIRACRTELCDLFPYLEAAFARLNWKASKQRGFHVDGDTIWFFPDDLLRLYAQSPGAVRRGYLHMLLHCLFLHLYASHANDRLWDLACDIAVESLIEEQEITRLSDGKKREFSRKGQSAEQIYEFLKENHFDASLEGLEADYRFDDHSWQAPGPGTKEKWEQLLLFAAGQKTGLGQRGRTSGAGEEVPPDGAAGEFDYRAYLRRFTFLREEVQLDLDSFDYAFYQLGMERYGSMPLIEPLEYQEVRRLEELVIAIDTSGSCSAEIVGKFLAETYKILASQENFFRKMKVYLIQCDCIVQDVTLVQSREDWMDYAKKIRIQGRGGTDFTPVFDYVRKLREQRELKDLKALLYFTDGDGFYPSAPPDYETAFVLLNDTGHPELVPKWAKCLLI